MFRSRRNQWKRISERGSTLVIVAAAMVGLLGVCAIAIDLAGYYLARAEAQRAADAAALAGASAFVNTGCATSGCTSGGMQEPLARQQAEAVETQIPSLELPPAFRIVISLSVTLRRRSRRLR